MKNIVTKQNTDNRAEIYGVLGKTHSTHHSQFLSSFGVLSTNTVMRAFGVNFWGGGSDE